MRFAPLCFGILGACGGPNDETLVDELRVIAVVVEPPEVQPGAAATITTWVADPLATEPQALVWTCTNLGDGYLEAGYPDLGTATGERVDGTVVTVRSIDPALQGVVADGTTNLPVPLWALVQVSTRPEPTQNPLITPLFSTDTPLPAAKPLARGTAMLITPLLFACTPPIPVEESDSNPHDSGALGDTAENTETDPGPSVIVLAGGGTEGELGDSASWSARLYGGLLSAGDTTGDGRVVVAILSTESEDDWLPSYFEWLGADDAFNAEVGTAAAVETQAPLVEAADIVFIKGGDQGEYYDLWNNTALESAIQSVLARGGGIGGTSAGAMSQAEFALAGGEDLVSADVLANSCTPYLDDASDGGSGIHDDFLQVLSGVLVDTHFTQRARLGRLAGALAKTAADQNPTNLVGIGIEEQTGLVVRNQVATVIGVGTVNFLRPEPGNLPTRVPEQPLVWTNLSLDRLTDGWTYDLAVNRVLIESPPATASAVAWEGGAGAALGEWYADGDLVSQEERFEVVVSRNPDGFATHEGTDEPVLSDAIGLLNAHDADRRAANDESMFRALYEHIGSTGFFVGEGGTMSRSQGNPEQVEFIDNPEDNGSALATLVIDTTGATWRSLSPSVSLSDTGDGSLQAAGLVGLQLHVLYSAVGDGWVYNTVSRRVEEAAVLHAHESAAIGVNSSLIGPDPRRPFDGSGARPLSALLP